MEATAKKILDGLGGYPLLIVLVVIFGSQLWVQLEVLESTEARIDRLARIQVSLNEKNERQMTLMADLLARCYTGDRSLHLKNSPP